MDEIMYLIENDINIEEDLQNMVSDQFYYISLKRILKISGQRKISNYGRKL